MRCNVMLDAKCVGFCVVFSTAAVDGELDMFGRHLQVMPVGYLRRVAKPLADDVRWKSLLQFRLPRRSQVVEYSRPLLEAGTADDASQLCSEVSFRIVAEHLGSVACKFPHVVEVWLQLRKDRDDSEFVTLAVFRLGAVHSHCTAVPVNVVPDEASRFRWHS